MPHAFTIRGRIGGKVVEAAWRDGVVRADPPIAEIAADRIIAGQRIHATPTGPSFTPGLTTWEPAYFTLTSCFDDVLSTDGDVPSYPLPKGAIG